MISFQDRGFSANGSLTWKLWYDFLPRLYTLQHFVSIRRRLCFITEFNYNYLCTFAVTRYHAFALCMYCSKCGWWWTVVTSPALRRVTQHRRRPRTVVHVKLWVRPPAGHVISASAAHSSLEAAHTARSHIHRMLFAVDSMAALRTLYITDRCVFMVCLGFPLIF